MRCFLPLICLSVVAGCAAPSTSAPSLAPRAAEAVDPRVPIPGDAPAGTLDPALATQLDALVSAARSGVASFDAQEAEATRLAERAGPAASEGWVAAQQALSRLVEQYGVTARAAADIEALASDRLKGQHWIVPADQEAIAAASADVAVISDRQTAAIDRIESQLAR